MPDRTAATNLDRFWDARVTGQRPEPSVAKIDPSFDEAVRRLHAANDVDRAGAAFAETLWENLMNAHTASFTSPNPASIGHGRPKLITAPAPSLIRPESLRSRLAAMAAAVLLLTALAGLASFFLLQDDDVGHTTGAPIFAPASPSDAGSNEVTLVDANLPAGSFTMGNKEGTDTAFFTLATIPSSSTGTWQPVSGDCQCEGVRIISVIDGSIALQAEGTVRVFRQNGERSGEEITAGTQTSVASGETVIFPSNVAYQVTNSAVTPARVFFWVKTGLIKDLDNTAYPETWQVSETYDSSGVGGAADPALTGTVTLQLRRVTLAAHKSSAPLLTGTWFLVTDPELTHYGANSDGSVTNITAAPLTLYLVTLAPVPGAGTPTT